MLINHHRRHYFCHISRLDHFYALRPSRWLPSLLSALYLSSPPHLRPRRKSLHNLHFRRQHHHVQPEDQAFLILPLLKTHRSSFSTIRPHQNPLQSRKNNNNRDERRPGLSPKLLRRIQNRGNAGYALVTRPRIFQHLQNGDRLVLARSQLMNPVFSTGSPILRHRTRGDLRR